jgi:hypothetical protein
MPFVLKTRKKSTKKKGLVLDTEMCHVFFQKMGWVFTWGARHSQNMVHTRHIKEAFF